MAIIDNTAEWEAYEIGADRDVQGEYMPLSGGTIDGQIKFDAVDKTLDDDVHIYRKNYYFEPTNRQVDELIIETSANDVENFEGCFVALRTKDDTGTNGSVGELKNSIVLQAEDDRGATQFSVFPDKVTSRTPATDDNSAQVATTAFVNNYALAKSGGTMSGGLVVDCNAQAPIKIMNVNDGVFRDITFTDTNDKRVGLIRANYNSANNGQHNIQLSVVDTTDVNRGGITVSYDEVNNVVYTNAPTPTKSSNTTNIATTAFVKTNLADYLPLAGGVITGGLINKITTVTRGTAPSAGVNRWGLLFRDNADKGLGGVYWDCNTDRVNRVSLYAYNGTSTTDTNASITIGFDKNGKVFTSAPTPDTASNTTQIATTAFVKAQGYVDTAGANTLASAAALASIKSNITTRDYTFEVSYPAGTVGTRGYNSSVSYALSGYTFLGCGIYNAAASGHCIPLAFVYSGKIYCSAFRCDTSAFAATTWTVRAFYRIS